MTAMKIIDAHIHCSNSPDDLLTSYAKFNELEYNLDELLSQMEKWNIESGLLLSPPMKDGMPLSNEKIVELCAKSRGTLFPVFTVEPSKEHVDATLELAKKSRDSLKGFKIRLGYKPVFASDPVFDELYDYAQSQNLPVLFHTGDTATSTGSLKHSHPLTLDELANSRQDLKIVACHFGNPWIDVVGELIYKHPNVFADISGLFTGVVRNEDYYAQKFRMTLARKISEAIYFTSGVDKILFGTDYPVEAHQSAISFARMLDMRREDSNKLFHDNAKRLFSL